MNSTVKTSRCFSKSRGLRASVPFFHLFALAPFFAWPEFCLLVQERLRRRLAKSKCLSSQCDEIHLQSFFASKDGARKTEFFCNMLFLKNEAQINKTNYAAILFMSTQVSPPKIRSILQKWKSTLNVTYALMARNPSVL